MMGLLKAVADGKWTRAWMDIPVSARNRMLADLCAAARAEGTSLDRGDPPSESALFRAWVGTRKGEGAVAAVWVLCLPYLLKLEGRGHVPKGWNEDEGGWLYGIVRSAVLSFDPKRGVPFVLFLANRVQGNCSSRVRRRAQRELKYSAISGDVQDATEDWDGEGAEVRRVAEVLVRDAGEGPVAEALRERIRRVLDLGEDRPRTKSRSQELALARRVIFSGKAGP